MEYTRELTQEESVEFDKARERIKEGEYVPGEEALERLGLEKESKAWGIASFVTALCSIILFLAPYFGLPLSVFAIVAYAIQNKKGSTGLAITGLILGILGTLLNLVTGLMFLVFVGLGL